jgi:selenocysteine lyase/cysteine desulfurase
LIINSSSRIWWGTMRSLWEIPIYKWLPYYLEWWVQNFWWILWLQWILTWRSMRTTSLVNSHVLSLSNYFLNKIIEEKLENEFKIISIPESSLVSLIPLHFNVIDFHQYCNYFLSDEIISFRTWTMCVDMFTQTYLQSEINIMRFSFALYNTPDEIDILFNAINSYLWLLKK